MQRYESTRDDVDVDPPDVECGVPGMEAEQVDVDGRRVGGGMFSWLSMSSSDRVLEGNGEVERERERVCGLPTTNPSGSRWMTNPGS